MRTICRSAQTCNTSTYVVNRNWLIFARLAETPIGGQQRLEGGGGCGGGGCRYPDTLLDVQDSEEAFAIMGGLILRDQGCIFSTTESCASRSKELG